MVASQLESRAWRGWRGDWELGPHMETAHRQVGCHPQAPALSSPESPALQANSLLLSHQGSPLVQDSIPFLERRADSFSDCTLHSGQLLKKAAI